jgi:tRNA G18 (ribose-2'-O)-methylase SpoU
MQSIVLIAHNIRSTHNIGSLLRTADGLGVEEVVFTGYTPYPHSSGDIRLPHIYKKIHAQIHKTALGAEDSVKWRREATIQQLLGELRNDSYQVIALEQAPTSVKLPAFSPPKKLAVVIGREVEGIEPEILKLCDQIVEIPMFGQKESFNVAVAAAIFLSYCQFAQK